MTKLELLQQMAGAYAAAKGEAPFDVTVVYDPDTDDLDFQDILRDDGLLMYMMIEALEIYTEKASRTELMTEIAQMLQESSQLMDRAATAFTKSL